MDARTLHPATEHPTDPTEKPGHTSVDVTLIDEMLRLSPGERLRQNDRVASLAARLKQAFSAKALRWPNHSR